MDLIKEIEKMGLTIEQYENCLQDIQDKKNGIKDIEWEEIRDKYNLQLSPEVIRKSNGTIFGGSFVAEYMKDKARKQQTVDDLDLKLEQIRKEKIKLQTLNVERNRIDRAEARQELYYESIGKMCSSLPLPDFKPLYPEKESEMSYVLEWSDIHYGADFVSQHNIYNREEAIHRLELSTGWAINFVEKHKVRKLHAVCLGDCIQGLIHISDLKLNDTDLVKCVVEISRIIATMLNRLSEHVEVEYYHVPTANHGQIRPFGTKANEIPSEDCEYIIGNYIKDLVRDNPRITVHLAKDGEQFVRLNLEYQNVYAMHGHQFKGLSNAMPNFASWLQSDVDTLLLGHFHAGNDMTVGADCVGECEILVAPSVCGSDPYADRLFKNAKAACKIYGFDNIYGHIETYKCILN